MENTIVVKIDSNFNPEGFTQLKTQLHDIGENTKKALIKLKNIAIE